MVDLLEVVHKLKEEKTKNYFMSVMYIFHKYILKILEHHFSNGIQLELQKKFQSHTI